ncbi:MAG: ArsR/SmtB family transcription factor [Candidatus Gracilibacteria bacterium]
MVEYTLSLDSIFGSLADPTRRDILTRVAKEELTVSEIAKPYSMSLAAISKHLKILEKAKLILKRRSGKEQYVQLSPAALSEASEYLEKYKEMWEERLDSLENYLSSIQKNDGKHS